MKLIIKPDGRLNPHITHILKSTYPSFPLTSAALLKRMLGSKSLRILHGLMRLLAVLVREVRVVCLSTNDESEADIHTMGPGRHGNVSVKILTPNSSILKRTESCGTVTLHVNKASLLQQDALPVW